MDGNCLNDYLKTWLIDILTQFQKENYVKVIITEMYFYNSRYAFNRWRNSANWKIM